MLVKSAADLVQEARQSVQNLSPEELTRELTRPDVVLLDLRESEELEKNGRIPGAVHAPRGMLEFYADPATPYHKPEIANAKRIILHCASGGRSALAASTLRRMGYNDVAHLDGGFKAWKEAGKPLA